MKTFAAVAAMVGALALAACEKQPAEQAAETPAETPTEESASMAPAPDSFLADNLKNPGWGQTASGLQFQAPEPRAEEGASQPTLNSMVTIHYEGKLTNGEVFDSSKGGDPVTFPLGQLIPGWQEGVPMMRVGETWNFAIPAHLGYGDRAAGPIPPNSTLLFEIQLLKFE